MTEFEQTLLQEISTLPESRRADVLAFVRYLKLSIPGEELEIEKRFEKSLKSIRARSKRMNITPEDIETEIRAVRAEHAHRSHQG
jgi:VIT1/CCC1 family predicted Fe2+/Mn2+ transporter